MIDSSKWAIIEAGLKCVQGKSIVNSISLKEGRGELPGTCPAVRRYGAAVVMAFDEEGQAVTVDDKVPICHRAFACSPRRSASTPTDIIFDANILTVGTGIEEHNNYAVEFIEAVRDRSVLSACQDLRRREQRLVRFRGNDVVREAMNAAFLYHAIKAGLDMGIVNAGQLQFTRRFPRTCSSASKTCCSIAGPTPPIG